MAKYGAVFSAYATATTLKTAVALNAGSAGQEGEIIECLMTGSGSATPADIQHRCLLIGWTFATAGINTSVTPEPFNDNAAAARITALTIYSTEGTASSGAAFVQYGFNQRGGMRWAVPRGEGGIFNNDRTPKGIAYQVRSNTPGEVDGHTHWWEP